MFEDLYKILIKDNLVKSEFIDEIIKRENDFPTGLQTSSLPIAMPHVEAKYVNCTALVIITNKKGIPFKRMDNPEEVLNCKIMFLFLVKDPSEHIAAITNLTKIFQNDKLLENILESENKEEVFELLKGIKYE